MALTPGSPAASASDGAPRRTAALAILSLFVLLSAELGIVLLAARKASLLAPPKRIPFTR